MTWTQPISAADLARGRLRLGEGFWDGYPLWLQSNPADQGRTTLMAARDGRTDDLTPDRDLRSSIHAYGGTPVAVRSSRLCFFDRRTDQVWVQEGGAARPVTQPGSGTYAGFSFVDERTVVCVRETPGDPEPRDAVVTLELGGDPAGSTVIASGADFYAAPAVSRDGWLAWAEWDHPNMPWDETRLVVRSPGGACQTVAGGPGVSALYPQWAGDGTLVFLADAAGYWTFHRWDGAVMRLNGQPFDFCSPPWTLTQPPYALLDDGRIGCSWWEDGWARLGFLNPDGTLTTLGEYGVATVNPQSDGRSVVTLGSPAGPPGVLALDWSSGALTPLAQESALVPDPVAVPELLTWGEPAVYGWWYPAATAGGPPPALVWPHSGPTSYSPAVYSLATQFFTSRGIAVLEVNYSGSSSFGRAYRQRLNGHWGVLDVAECIAGARYLAESGRADPARLGIIGSSAGGFTALAALTTTPNPFSLGVSLYGISDLEALMRDTSKFESHYTAALVAPYPAGRATYVERSPLTHVDRLRAPVLLLQGTDDPVVPPSQAQWFLAAAQAQGLDAELHLYDAEGHGFRQAATIEAAYTAIAAFLDRHWG